MEKILKSISKAVRNTDFAGKTFLVGGYVRDLILGTESGDIDIVVEMDQGGKRLAEFLHEKGLTGRPVYFERFGTSCVEINGVRIELVMSRKESYPDRTRKPSVEYGTIKEDILRRDFTINTLLMDMFSEEIHDLTGLGKSDIKSGLIRSTSEPEVIFNEDPLRMLRAVRFAVQLGFEIEPDTAKGIHENKDRLAEISWERRRDELSKMLTSPSPDRAVRLLFHYDLIRNVIPELEGIRNLEQNRYHDKDVLGHTLLVLKKTKPDLGLRLAALLHDIGKQLTWESDNGEIHFYGHEQQGQLLIGAVMKRLKYPGSLRREVLKLTGNHMRLKQAGSEGEKISDKTLRRLSCKMGKDLDKFLDLVHADNLSHSREHRMANQVPELRSRIRELNKEIDKKKVPVNGNDIKKLFKIETGESVGKYLRKAEDIWFEDPGLSREEILEKITFEEEIMEKESKVTRITREGVRKAYDLGEDLVNALGRITREIISTAKDEDLSSKEKVHKLAKEALEGAKEGAKHAQPGAEEFLKKAGKTIVESIKVAAPKIAHFAQDALKGAYEGAKDVYEDKHTQKPETEKEDQENKE